MPARQTGRYRPAFEPVTAGDIAPRCVLPALDGATVDLYSDAIAGNPIVIVFCPKFTSAVAEALAGFRGQLQEFVSAGARLFAVTLEQAKAVEAQAIPFPVLCDREGAVFRDFGVDCQRLPTTVVLRPNHHDDGFSWQGTSYRSLSALAGKITGTAWSGPLFFGLKANRTAALRLSRGPRSAGEDGDAAN
jgi:peroxiredoxin